MDAQKTERLKVEFSKVPKSYLPWVSTTVTAIAFILSRQELTIVSAFITILIIIGLTYLAHLLIYAGRYTRYLIRTERSHDRLMQLYGEKESEIVEKDRIISSYPEQLIKSSTIGFVKGYSAAENEYSTELAGLDNKDINILEKSAGSNGVELTFDVGTNDGIEEGILLSIVTKHSDDLWGVVIIIWVSEENSRGEVFTKINNEFWRKMETEMYSDAAPPQNVKARLYDTKDFSYEMKLHEDKIKKKR